MPPENHRTQGLARLSWWPPSICVALITTGCATSTPAAGATDRTSTEGAFAPGDSGLPEDSDSPEATGNETLAVRVRNNTGADLSTARVALENSRGEVLTTTCTQDGWAYFDAFDPAALPVNLTAFAPGASTFSYVNVDSQVIERAEPDGGITLWLKAPTTNGASLSTDWPDSGELYTEVVIRHSQGLVLPLFFESPAEPWLIPVLGDEALSLIGIEVVNTDRPWTNAWRRFDHDGVSPGQVQDIIWSEALDTNEVSLRLPRPPLGHKLRGSSLSNVRPIVTVLEEHPERPGILPVSLVLWSDLDTGTDSYSVELEHLSAPRNGGSLTTRYMMESETSSSWVTMPSTPVAGAVELTWPPPPTNPTVNADGGISWESMGSGFAQLSITGETTAWHLVAPPGTLAIRLPALPDGVSRDDVLRPGEQHTMTLGRCEPAENIPGCASGATSTGHPIRFN